MGDTLGMQYIMDGNGNYYTINSNNQLVVARDRDEASIFTFFEANQRIGTGMKSKYYQAVPVDYETEYEQEVMECEEAEEECKTGGVTSAKVYSIVDKIPVSKSEDGARKQTILAAPVYEYSMEEVDWKEFTNYFIFLSSGARGYQEELATRHADVEKELQDLLHYVELYNLSEEETMQTMEMLKDARQRRRDVKDEEYCVEYFQKMLGTSANVAKAKGYLTELKKLDTRQYHPRQLEALFEGMEEKKTDRDLYRQNRDVQMDEPEADDIEFRYDEEEVEMCFEETIFDNRENDWTGFARQQMEFYQNAGQYMMNLQIGINDIDEAIENIMEQIEDANLNVTQGYKVFKELKDLRNERKKKAEELRSLKTMTECFDMSAMAEAFESIVGEMA